MPRTRSNLLLALPPRKIFSASTSALFNLALSDAEYRLYHVILALSWQTGYVDCNNAELGQVLGLTRETVRRLLGTLSRLDLVEESTLANGRRRLTPAAPGDLATALQPSRLIEPASETYQNSEGEKPSSKTHHGGIVMNSWQLSSQKYDDTIYHEEEDLNLNNIKLSSSSFGVSSQKYDDTSPQDCWQRYFGPNSRADDLLGQWLVADDVGQAASAAEMSAAAWLIESIETTANYQPKRPLPYLKKLVGDKLSRANGSQAAIGNPAATLPAEPDPEPLTAIWAETTAILRLQMDRDAFNANLLNSSLSQQVDGVYQVEAPPLAIERLKSRLGDRVKQALEIVVGQPITLEFVPQQETQQYAT